MKKSAPLAEQLRPQKLEEIVGQDQLLHPDGLIQRSIRKNTPPFDDFMGTARIRQNIDR